MFLLNRSMTEHTAANLPCSRAARILALSAQLNKAQAEKIKAFKDEARIVSEKRAIKRKVDPDFEYKKDTPAKRRTVLKDIANRSKFRLDFSGLFSRPDFTSPERKTQDGSTAAEGTGIH
jgi:hypothetical protein